jgi:hypothetical protein
MDRWFPPSIEILDVTPIYISEPRNRGDSLRGYPETLLGKKAYLFDS